MLEDSDEEEVVDLSDDRLDLSDVESTLPQDGESLEGEIKCPCGRLAFVTVSYVPLESKPSSETSSTQRPLSLPTLQQPVSHSLSLTSSTRAAASPALLAAPSSSAESKSCIRYATTAMRSSEFSQIPSSSSAPSSAFTPQVAQVLAPGLSLTPARSSVSISPLRAPVTLQL